MVNSYYRKFSFSGVRTNQILHDHNYKNEPEKIYLQGAGGYEATLNILGYDALAPKRISTALEKLKKTLNEKGKSAHIIGANIRLYVDDVVYKDQKNKDKKELLDTVSNLFLYKLAPNTKTGGKEQLEDLIANTNYKKYQGQIFKDNEGDFFYEFKITNYITALLKKENKENITPLGLKVYYPTDAYNPRTKNIEVEQFNLFPKGVILSNPNAKGKKKIILKITYGQTDK